MTLINLRSFGNAVRGLVVVATTVLVSACGGGGGGSAGGGAPVPTLNVSPAQVSVTSSSGAAAPTAVLQASVTNAASAPTYYLDIASTQHGIASISPAQAGSVINITISFNDPAALGLGTYSDTITLKAC